MSDEDFEYDLLNSEEVQVDFTPLFEALHIHESLGQMDKFRSEYAATRRRQKELLLPPSISLVDDDMANLHTLLEDIAGFAIVERATMKRVPDLRSAVDVSQPPEFLPRTVTQLANALHRSTSSGTRYVKQRSHLSERPCLLSTTLSMC